MAAPTVSNVATHYASGGGAPSVTSGASASIGDLLVVFLSNDFYTLANFSTSLTITGCTASATHVTAADCDAGTNNVHCMAWTAPVTGAGTPHVAASTGHGDEEVALTCYIISGADVAADTANKAFNASNSTTWAGGAITTSVANCLVIAHWAGNSASGSDTITRPSGWSSGYHDLGDTVQTNEGAYQTFASAGSIGSYSCTSSKSRGYGSSTVAIPPATGGGSPPTAQKPLNLNQSVNRASSY